MPKSPALLRFNRRVLTLSVIYALMLVGAAYLFNRHLVVGASAVVAGILPALPIVGIFVAIGYYLIEERDEYLRMLKVRETLWASGFALSVATIWGFLESFDIVGHVEAFYVAVLWFGGLGLGACANKLTFGRAK